MEAAGAIKVVNKVTEPSIDHDLVTKHLEEQRRLKDKAKGHSPPVKGTSPSAIEVNSPESLRRYQAQLEKILNVEPFNVITGVYEEPVSKIIVSPDQPEGSAVKELIYAEDTVVFQRKLRAWQLAGARALSWMLVTLGDQTRDMLEHLGDTGGCNVKDDPRAIMLWLERKVGLADGNVLSSA